MLNKRDEKFPTYWSKESYNTSTGGGIPTNQVVAWYEKFSSLYSSSRQFFTFDLMIELIYFALSPSFRFLSSSEFRDQAHVTSSWEHCETYVHVSKSPVCSHGDKPS